MCKGNRTDSTYKLFAYLIYCSLNQGQPRILQRGVRIKGGSRRKATHCSPDVVSLKQGVWGVQPPRSYGGLFCLALKSHMIQDCSVLKLNLYDFQI